ncbi:MAG: hypothetical protein QNL96_01925 [SAR86 cluster bacterium]
MSDALSIDDVDIDVDINVDIDAYIDTVDSANDFDESAGSIELSPNMQRHDVRRKIEEMMERRRLREEFGELDF